MKNALITVYNKVGLSKLVPFLECNGFKIFSTGGTFNNISELVNNKDTVQQLKFPELCDGRVKTLQPEIFSGILDKNKVFYDVVAVNMYPFEHEQSVENIDIGGYSLIRAAMKNSDLVTVLTEPEKYIDYIQMKTDGAPDEEINRYFAGRAANILMKNAISVNNWYNGDEKIGVSYEKDRVLKYGLNPEQKPSYVYRKDGNVSGYKTLNGNPSYINLLDANNASKLVSEVKETLGLDCCASFKHNSPAGVATHVSNIPELIYENTVKIDPLSSYGDFLAFSGDVNLEIAELLKPKVSDGIIAAGFEHGVMDMLSGKKKGGYVILEQDSESTGGDELEFRDVNGETLVQPEMSDVVEIDCFSDEINRDLMLGAITLKYTQSNSICFIYKGKVIGIGAGQQNRVDCIKIAGRKTIEWFERNKVEDSDRSGLCMVSDGFLPFADNIEVAQKYGVKYISQPGGSIRDKDVQEACDNYNIQMVITGQRLFTH